MLTVVAHVWGIHMNFGQTCHAGTRIYVHEKIYDEFIKLYKQKMQAIQVGDNFDGENEQGPQNSKMQFDKIWATSQRERKREQLWH